MRKLTPVILLLFLLSLCGCAGSERNIDADWDTGEESTREVPQPLVSELTREELDGLADRFTLADPFGEENWWYNMALTSQYARAEELDLYMYFYNGFRDEQAGEDERKELEAQGMWMELDIQKNPVPRMDAVLRQYFGLSLEQMAGVGLEGMIYLPETDSYYKCCGDVCVAENVVFHAGFRSETGELQLYYFNYLEEEWVLTIKPNPNGEEGAYQMISNMPTGNGG